MKEIKKIFIPCVLTAVFLSELVLGMHIIDDFWVYDNTSDLIAKWNDGSINNTGSTISLPGLNLPVDPNDAFTEFIRPIGIMQLDYNNTVAPYRSEVDLLFTPPMNGVMMDPNNTLSISYRGLESNDPTEMYVKITDDTSTITFENPLSGHAVTDPWWKTCNLRFCDLQNAGLNLSAIVKLTIGVGNGINSNSGTVYIDDLCLRYTNHLPEYQRSGDIDDNFVINQDDLKAVALDWLLEDFLVSAHNPGTASLQAHYAFNETTGTTANDSSGNGFHASVNSPDKWSGGGYDAGGCLVMDDTTEVMIPASVMTGISNEITLSIWVKGVSEDYPDSVHYVCFQSGNSTEEKKDWDKAGWTIHSSEHYSDWHHYAVTKEVDTETVKFYHDGILVAKQQDQNQMINGADTSATVLLRDSDGSIAWIDDLKVYDRAFTHNEIIYLVGGIHHQITQPIFPLFTGADIDRNGNIDLKDLSIMSQNWLWEY